MTIDKVETGTLLDIIKNYVEGEPYSDALYALPLIEELIKREKNKDEVVKKRAEWKKVVRNYDPVDVTDYDAHLLGKLGQINIKIHELMADLRFGILDLYEDPHYNPVKLEYIRALDDIIETYTKKLEEAHLEIAKEIGESTFGMKSE